MQCIRSIQSCLRACLPRCMTSCLETEHDEHDEHAPLLGGPPVGEPPRNYFSAPSDLDGKMKPKVRSASSPIATKVRAHFEAFEYFSENHPELNTYSIGTPSHTVPFHTAVRANYKDWDAGTNAAIRGGSKNATHLRQISQSILENFRSPYGDNPGGETREHHYLQKENMFLICFCYLLF